MPCKVILSLKLDTVYNITTFRTRHAGWQERFYSPIDDPFEAARVVREGAGPPGGGLLVKRAALLARQAYIDGFTCQSFVTMDGVGEVAVGNAISFEANQYGPPRTLTDYPQSALLVSLSLQGGAPQRIRFPIRGIPEENIVTGEWDNTDRPYKTAVGAYLQEVAAGYGTYVDQLVGAAFSPRRVVGISTLGVLTYLGEAGPFNVDGLVKITRTTFASGRRGGGIYRIATVDGDARRMTLVGWPTVITTGGLVRNWTRVFARFALNSGVITRAMTKKTGGKRDYRGANRSTRV